VAWRCRLAGGKAQSSGWNLCAWLAKMCSMTRLAHLASTLRVLPQPPTTLLELHNETRFICLDDLTYMIVWYWGRLPVDVTQPKIMWKPVRKLRYHQSEHSILERTADCLPFVQPADSAARHKAFMMAISVSYKEPGHECSHVHWLVWIKQCQSRRAVASPRTYLQSLRDMSTCWFSLGPVPSRALCKFTRGTFAPSNRT
jgi:hypothetical protein